jgi:hypothetical protein
MKANEICTAAERKDMKQPTQSPEGRARCPKRAEEGIRLAGRSQEHDAHVHFGFWRSDFGTRIVLCLILVLPIAGAALAQPTPIVVPNGLANVEGNSSGTEPFNSTSFRFQQVFDASQFAIPPGASGLVNSISFRVDGATTSNVLLFFGGSSWTLSTTTRSPDGLSPAFADNRGADAVTAFNGAFGFGGNPPVPGMPGEFQNPTVILTSEFYYIPLRGNLLLDVSGAGGQAFLPGSLDAYSLVGDSISWVWSADGNSASGTANTLGLVTRFDVTIVPEPATWLLGLAGLALLVVFRRS